jgi:hypothetical protein
LPLDAQGSYYFLKIGFDRVWSGFATAFSTEEAKEALEFFKKYGIVVFKDVLTKDEQNGKKIVD